MMWEMLERNWLYFLLFGLMLITNIINIIREVQLFPRGGRVESGFKITSRPLTLPESEFLRNMQEDLLIKSSLSFFSHEVVIAFIRVEDKKRFIKIPTRGGRMGRRRPISYTGYVDLTQSTPKLAYKAPVFLCFFVGILLIISLLGRYLLPFFALFAYMIYEDFRTKANDIDAFLQEQISKKSKIPH